MKKGTIRLTVGAIMSAFVISAAAVSAAAVTTEDAQKTALDAVGLTEDKVIFKPAHEDFDDGSAIIEVDFFVPGEVKYEFDIDAATGAIREQSMDLWEAEDDFEYASLIEAARGGAVESGAAEAAAGEITELQAKTIAMKDAGLTPDAVTFSKCHKDMDDGMMRFEVELYTADGMEYSYDISAADGRILEKDADRD